MDDLDDLRRRIDETDRQLLETLALRLKFVAEVGRLKSKGVPFLRDPARESALMAKVEAQAKEMGLDPFRVTEIFREVIAMSVKVQEETLLDRKVKERALGNAHRVSFQGAEGAYSHLAARKYFGDREGAIEFRGFPTFSRALREAESGEAGYAFLPIENTTAGSINETYDLLRHTELRIVGEEILEVRHCLLGLPGASLAGIARVVSHPQALAQCSHFLAELPGVTAVPFVDTAEAARHVKETGDLALAAIASEEAGQRHGLEILKRDIADQEENWTRFVVVSALALTPDPRIPTKTSLVFSAPHRHGALAHCLNFLDAHGLNLTKLESRPVPRHPWEYLFYVDFEGAETEDAASRAIASLTAECPYLKVLGSYPARTTKKGRVDRLPKGPGTGA
ncbi:MAG: prephenate dehydratase [Acidobacteriota bacterium]